jgi:hypothetical protein
MNVGRLFFGTAVLPDGRVWAIGGEYTGRNRNTFANSAEIFSPTAGSGGTGTWTTTASFPQTQFGDDPVEVLSPTQVLAGYIVGPQTYLYNPTTNTWTQTGSKLRNDASDEETWVKLPDGSILSYDVFSSISTGVFHAQRYVPSSGTWVDASNLDPSNPPHILSDNNEGDELGPGLLLPNGKVFLLGANGYTAYYDPVADLWSAGPVLPTNSGTQLVAADAPAAMMANGDVLMALSPLGTLSGNAYTFPSPTYFYEFNPNDGSYTYANLTFSSDNSFVVCMLDLPNGQVLVTNESQTLEFYTPVGNPQSTWRPTVTGHSSNGSGVYTLTGTQFNGLSEGASYGDDDSMAENYPIVQFKDSAGNISYGRTANWSSVGVATGSTPVTTQVTLPAGHTSITDFASLTVIADGISSPTYTIGLPAITSLSTSQGGTAGGTTVTINGTNLANVTSVNFGSAAATIMSTSPTQVVVTSPAGTVGTVDVTATSWYGTSNTVAADQFTYVAPITVTAANINISGATGPGGVYRVGDVVTATWNNSSSGDNNADAIASVAVNFSQFGGPTAVSAVNNSNIWTATYAIAAGSINAANRDVIVSAMDSGANVTTTTGNNNATVDNVLPTVTPANINISGATGTGGAFRPGDTVTASWNNTSSGDNNAEAIASVSVDFSQFGGPTAVAASNSGNVWTASYTILSGVTPGNNRNVIVTVTDAVGNTKVTTDDANATIATPPNVTSNPSSVITDAGGNASFTAAAGGSPAPGVQWEVSTDGGATFTPVNGATSATYSFTATAAQNNNQYEAIFTNAAGSATTTAALLQVDSVTSQPANHTINAGQSTSFTAASSNPGGADTVQWMVNSGSGFTNLSNGGVYSGVTTPTLTITSATASVNGNQYEAVFTNSSGTLASNAATLTIDFAPNVTTNPTNQIINAGNTATFTAAAGGNPAPTVQWQVSTDGGATFTPINGATSTSYSFTASASQNGNQYEAVFTNSIGSAPTTAASLTVQFAPGVTTNPTNQSVGAGVTATFTAAAGGNPAPTVQWQVSTDGGATFTPINGATSTTYSFTASAGQNGDQYDAVFTNSVGTATTTAATLAVVPTIGTWASSVNGPWNVAGNWTDTQGAGVPGFSGLTGDQATFNSAAGLNVDLGNFSPNLAVLTFGPAAPNYVIKSTGSGVLQMNNGNSNATINVSAGSQTISAPVQLSSNTKVLPATSTALTVTNSLTGNTGVSLTIGDVSHPGTLVASPTATVTLPGATNVPAGTLQVDGAWNSVSLNVAAPGAGPGLYVQGTGSLSGSGAIAVNAGLFYNSTTASTFAGSLAGGSSAVLEVDGGRLTLSGPSTIGFSGGIVVTGGKLVVDHASDLPDDANLTIGSSSAFPAPIVASSAAVAPAASTPSAPNFAPATVAPPSSGGTTTLDRASAVDVALQQPLVKPAAALPRSAPAIDWLFAQASLPSWVGPSQQNVPWLKAVDMVMANRAG